jgi:flagellar biosynthesis protein FliR
MIVGITQLEVFCFILARLAGIFIQAPLFNTRSIATSGKVALAVWLALLLWFVTPVSPALPNSFLLFVLVLIAEIFFGFTIGLICNVTFVALQSAGEIIDMQMGLSVAQSLDPVFGSVISIIGRLIGFVSLVMFITVDGHHLLLSAFHQSFVALPAGRVANFGSGALVLQTMNLGSILWMTAIKLAAPIVLLIFLVDFSFGIVSRVAPQVNVFMLGFQVKPFVGLFGFLMCLPFLLKYVNQVIALMGTQILQFIAAVK